MTNTTHKVGERVVLVGVLSPESEAGSCVMGSITLQWGSASPKVKSYGFAAPLRLESGQVVTLNGSLGSIPGEETKVAWSRLEKEDFVQEFLSEAPGPHVKVKVDTRVLRARERVAVVGTISSMRFALEDSALRDSAQQEIEALDAELITTGEDAEAKIREHQAAIERQRELAEKRAQRQSLIASLRASLRQPMKSLRQRAWNITCATIALLALYLLVQRDPTLGAALWGVGLLGLSAFGWFWLTAPLPLWFEDGNEVASWPSTSRELTRSYYSGRSGSPSTSRLPSLKQVKTSPYKEVIKIYAPSDAPYISSWPVPMVVFTLGFFLLIFGLVAGPDDDSGLVMVQGILWILILAFLLLWSLLYFKRANRARLLLSAPPSALDNSWGRVSGEALTPTDDTAFVYLSARKHYRVKFSGATWAATRHAPLDSLSDVLCKGEHLLVVGRAGPNEISLRGPESLFVYISDGPAIADLRYRLSCWAVASLVQLSCLVAAFVLLW